MKNFKSMFLLVFVLICLTSCNNNVALNMESEIPSNENIDYKKDDEFMKKLDEYAELIIRKGVNVQKGKKLYIDSYVECYEFTRLCVEKAYKYGASDVIINWQDEDINKQFLENASDELIDQTSKYDVELGKMLNEEDVQNLIIYSQNPDIYEKVDPNKLVRQSIAHMKAYGDYEDRQGNMEIPWCVAGVPNVAWAKKVFPEMSEDEAMKSLWDMILKTVYVNGDNKSIEIWDNHLKKLDERAEKLNEYNFKSLHYTNSLGTDLTIELPKGHRWVSGSMYAPNGVEFIANMPTEEIFSAPLKNGINGKIYASMPVVYNGTVVNDLNFNVQDGKIVEINATTGLDVMKEAVAYDENACYFGEVSLVPYDSPISNTKKLFYNILYDENASCHMAFGSSYPECLSGGKDMSEEELINAGLNVSDQHVDFMVGTSDLQIVGTTYDGNEIEVFKNGNFAF